MFAKRVQLHRLILVDVNKNLGILVVADLDSESNSPKTTLKFSKSSLRKYGEMIAVLAVILLIGCSQFALSRWKAHSNGWDVGDTRDGFDWVEQGRKGKENGSTFDKHQECIWKHTHRNAIKGESKRYTRFRTR